MKIERVECEFLTFDPHNVREHDERNVEAIKESLIRFGQQKPIVVDGDGVVIAGNGTLGAAKMLGWTHIDIVRTKLTGEEAVAFAIADNRTAELARWDDQGLAAVLDSLNGDLAFAAGYSESELANVLRKAEQQAENEGIVFDPEYLVLVTCRDEKQQAEVYQLCQKENLDAKLVQ